MTCALSPFTSPLPPLATALTMCRLGSLARNLTKFKTLKTPQIISLLSSLITSALSKGYDGSGIVYSDLDRLCDGVMGFLLKCLQGSETLLTHYNPQITQIIQALKSSIGKGLGVSGFASAIEQVKSGLQGYEGGMEERIAEVRKPLQTMKESFQNLEMYLSNASNKNLKTQLDHVRGQARLYWTAAGTASNSSQGVKQEIQALLKNMTQRIQITSKKQILQLKSGMNEITTNGAGQCNLEKKISGLIGDIKEMDREIQGGAKRIGSSIQSAVQEVIDALAKLDEKVKMDLGKLEKAITQSLETYFKTQITAVVEAAKVAESTMSNNGGPGVDALKAASLAEGALKLLIDGLPTKTKSTGMHGVIARGIEGFLHALQVYGQVKSGIVDLEKNQLFNAFKDDIEKQVNDIIKEIEPDSKKFKDIFENLNTEIEGSIGNDDTINAKTNRIKLKLATFFKSQINGVTDEFHLTSQDAFGSYYGAHTSALAAIEDAVMKINDLESLPGASLMDSINDVEGSVDIADKELQIAIETISDSLLHARSVAHERIKFLKNHCIAKVSSAFTALTHQVQSLFAKQKQAELAALESVVTQQLKEIDKIIKDDSINGLKGFLSDLQYSITQQFPNGSLNDSTKLPVVAIKLVQFFDPLFEYVIRQLTPKTQMLPSTSDAQSTDPKVTRVRSISTKLNKLLTHLMNNNNRTYNFDYTFETNLDELKQSVRALGASKFGDGAHPDLLNLIKCGMTDFDTQLDYAYVSRYSERTSVDNNSSVYAKIGMTIIPILLTDFEEILANTDDIGDWLNLSLNLGDNNALGSFLKTAGYDVPTVLTSATVI
ncbi:hypothetical protein, conserved [Babesia bigemina]|uniref:Uncharacterized protein n=1 Tax=Babesia bigemina TaxID=5866 RepID=A0A061BQ68_BABBI|nr:hypothetical protein, conserved [Babesia bigemina]CDR71612.1 hypothetical protein, conserved [Babesia bigemina]|eukprot:XP_012770559.1 hypothetical protein, conserved [Babesia bigemina]